MRVWPISPLHRKAVKARAVFGSTWGSAVHLNKVLLATGSLPQRRDEAVQSGLGLGLGVDLYRLPHSSAICLLLILPLLDIFMVSSFFFLIN